MPGEPLVTINSRMRVARHCRRQNIQDAVQSSIDQFKVTKMPSASETYQVYCYALVEMSAVREDLM